MIIAEEALRDDVRSCTSISRDLQTSEQAFILPFQTERANSARVGIIVATGFEELLLHCGGLKMDFEVQGVLN